MTITLYGIKACDTMKKARTWLDEQGVSYAFHDYKTAAIDRASLLRYLVSFRNHNEFHEQCVERIFCDLWQRCAPEALAVHARYTRRGGLDINPFRSSGPPTAPDYPAPDNTREVRQ